VHGQFKSYSKQHRWYLRGKVEFVNAIYDWFLAYGKEETLMKFADD
jgi:hypothetical protein